jgi:hypothetical protein
MQLDLSLYLHAFMEQPASPAVLSILAVNNEAFRTKFGKASNKAVGYRDWLAIQSSWSTLRCSDWLPPHSPERSAPKWFRMVADSNQLPKEITSSPLD